MVPVNGVPLHITDRTGVIAPIPPLQRMSMVTVKLLLTLIPVVPEAGVVLTITGGLGGGSVVKEILTGVINRFTVSLMPLTFSNDAVE